MPRSAIMITKSLRLNLKLVYQLTQRMMIWPSKCRPLNSASIGPKGRILPSSAIGSVCTRTGPKGENVDVEPNADVDLYQTFHRHTNQAIVLRLLNKAGQVEDVDVIPEASVRFFR